MLSQIPHKLFMEWKFYYELEPFGPLRDNFHAALIATSIWQSNMEPRERNQIGVTDFMYGDASEKEPLEPQEIFVMLKAHLVRGHQDVNR